MLEKLNIFCKPINHPRDVPYEQVKPESGNKSRNRKQNLKTEL